MHPPRFDGHNLVNLVAELEHRLTGQAASPRLDSDLAATIPEGSTYVLVLFDGLGSHQLQHPAAEALSRARTGDLDAPFPTTTTVSLATIATGLTPRQHGVIGHHMWMPDLGEVVNVLKWILPGGTPVDYPTASLLPDPNLWERLSDAGVEPITIQPGAFEFSPLSRALYRGCRIEPVWTEDEIAAATIDLAGRPGRLILSYLPHVDVAAHLHGQHSEQYGLALRRVAAVWERIAHHLPDHAVLIGTADHGHADYHPADKIMIERAGSRGLTFFGDPRSLYVRGDRSAAAHLAENLPATWHDLEEFSPWWGSGMPHPQLEGRAPTGLLMAAPGALLLPSNMDRRLIGYHGGLDEPERLIPLLIH